MKKGKKIADVVIFLLLIFIAIVILYPFVWMVLTSFKPKMHVYLGGLLPQVWDFSSYLQIWNEIPMVRGFLNTSLYSVPPVLIGTLVSGAAAFAFAKVRFKGRDTLFLILLIGLMIPFPAIMVPQFVLFSEANLLNGPWTMILPKLFGNISMVFFVRQIISSWPDSLTDAAKIDGCNYWQMYWKIVLPNIRYALYAHGVLWFIAAWNDYLGPTLFIQSPIWEPVTVMIAKYNAQYEINNHIPRIMAGSVLLITPVLIIYGIFQKYIVESFVFSGIKG